MYEDWSASFSPAFRTAGGGRIPAPKRVQLGLQDVRYCARTSKGQILETITIILVLLVAVTAGSFISRATGKIVPVPLAQIALGALAARVFDFQISLPPEVFFLLFVAPLLFLDGWRIPKEGLFRDKWTILALALGLVVFTVLGAGIFIHWLVSSIPLPVAFALAAALSPTDAVAVAVIAERVPLPKRLMHILVGESLLNDASGLVCLRFAIAAAVTGGFSLVEASITFLWLALGGVGIGVAVAMIANAAKDWTARHFGEETGTQILISLLIPFGAYLVADRAAASGILAAVAAGIAMSYEERSGRASAVTRIRRAAVWDALQFASNGVIFVLLGWQLPAILGGAGQAIRQTTHKDEVWLVFYIVAISAALALLRTIWSWATLQLVLFRSAGNHPKSDTPGWRLIAMTSLAGVRGAVTLSAVMTFPLALRNGTAFPTRDLVILLAAGVIIMTLLAANVGLPYLTRGMKSPALMLERQKEDDARLAAARAAIAAVEQALPGIGPRTQDVEVYRQAAARIMARYQQQIEVRDSTGSDGGPAAKSDEIERNLHLVALRAERNELYRIAHSGQLTEELTRMLVREVDLQESLFSLRWPQA